MKRLLPALILGLLASNACSDQNSFLFVEGRVTPDGTCQFKPAQGNGPFDVLAVQNPPLQLLALGSQSRFMGFQVHNALSTGTIVNTSMTNTSDPSRDDVTLTEADIVANDTQGNQLATETLVVNSFVPVGDGIAIVDVMGGPLANAIVGLMAFPKVPPNTQTLLLDITFKGHTQSGSPVSTEQFTYPLELDGVPAWLDTTVQGNTQTIALLPDGGVADAVIQQGGTEQLGDLLPDGGVVNQVSTTYAKAALDAMLGSNPDAGGVGVPAGVATCE